MTVYEQVNGKPKESFLEGFRYYDEGIKAAVDGKPFNEKASKSWKDGYMDVKSCTKL